MTRFGTMAAALAAAAVLAGCGGGGFAPPARSGDTGVTPRDTGNTGVIQGNTDNKNTGNNSDNGNTGNTGGSAPAPDPDREATYDNLIAAIAGWDVLEVRRLLNAGVNPNQRDELGGTPLHAASVFFGVVMVGEEEDAVAVFRELLAAGADPNLTHPAVLNETPLHHVVRLATLEVDPELSPGSGNLESMIDVIRLLLNAGADPNARGDTGDTPLDEVESLVRFLHPSPQEQRLHRRLLPLFQNAGGGREESRNGNSGNGSRTCPAGQTGTPPNCRSGNSQSRRGPGHTETLGGARSALAALDGRAQRLTPIYAEANCHSGSERGTCNTRNRVPNIGVSNAGLRHPGNMGWAVPSDVGPYRQFVGRFGDVEGDTVGAWGEWAYAYTARGDIENLRSNSTPTRRHGTASGDGGCDRADYGCTALYVLANHGGLLYEGTPGGTATYEGRTWAGLLGANAETARDQAVTSLGSFYWGNATLTADFDRSSVNARFHDFTGSEPELRNGITFSGIPLIGSDGQFLQDTGGRYINGAFYGPDGTEAAGTWYVDGTTPTRRSCGAGGGSLCNDGHVIIGSFVTTAQTDQ